jgi:hypothetical protein
MSQQLCRTCTADGLAVNHAFTAGELAFLGMSVFEALLEIYEMSEEERAEIPQTYLSDGIACSRKILLACPETLRAQLIKKLEEDGLKVEMACKPEKDQPAEALN